MSLWAVRRMNVQLETEQLEDTDQNKHTLHCRIHFLNRPTDSKNIYRTHKLHPYRGKKLFNTTPFSKKDKSINKIKNGRGQTKERLTWKPRQSCGSYRETSESVWQLKLFKGNCWTFILDADIKDWENTEGGKKQNLPDVLIQLWCFLFPCNTRTNLLHCK